MDSTHFRGTGFVDIDLGQSLSGGTLINVAQGSVKSLPVAP